MKEKKNIAVVWGGYSSEIVVSEKSMAGVCSFIDSTKYSVYSVCIKSDSWTAEVNQKTYAVDKNDFSITVDGEKIKFDFVYITIHGTPGEDGKLQGYLDMLHIPYSACGVLASSLTMNKFICNKYLNNFGIKTAKSLLLHNPNTYNTAQIIDELGLPVFVKPNSGGSSFATTKVKEEKELIPAIEAAFEETSEVIIESFIDGTEVTCGCYKIADTIIPLPLTEVVTDNVFFDFDAKYNGQVEEITPARINQELTKKIQNITSYIYELIGAKGIIRVDYIISDEQPYLLEVNTTPGMTSTSFIPQQIAAAGLDITKVFSEIIENECHK